MRKFNIFTVFIITAMTALTLALPAAAALSDPVITAETALLVETKSGKILYEKNKDNRVAPGELARIMTLLLAAQAVEDGQATLKDNITASETFLDGMSEGASGQNFKPGETMHYGDLMYCAYLSSDSDACNILAEAIGGSVTGFVDRMNEKAEELGCDNTHFVNTGGAADPAQFTSAMDQYLILREAVGHPLFLKIAGTASYKAAATNVSPERSLLNPNALVRRDSGYFYKPCAAGKTSAVGDMGYSLVSYAQNDALSLISVVFGVKGSGTAKDAGSYAETIRLFDWGFSGFAWQDIVQKYEVTASEKIAMAKGTDTIELKPADSIIVLARRDITANDIKKDIVLYNETEGLTAPVKEGDILGEMTVYMDGTVCGKVGLAAMRDVELDKGAYIKNQISETLSRFWVQVAIFVFLVAIGLYIGYVIRDARKRREQKRKIEEIKKKIIEERQKQSVYK